jgi:hypothetical protein
LDVVRTRNKGKDFLLFGLVLFGRCGKWGIIVFSITLWWMHSQWLTVFKDYRGNGSWIQ